MGEEGLYIAKKVPVLTTTQRDLLIAVEGMLIFNSTTGQYEGYISSAWQALGKVYGDATFITLALLTTRGDMIRRGASVPERFAKGSSGQVLTMGANDPAWAVQVYGEGHIVILPREYSAAGQGTWGMTFSTSQFPNGTMGNSTAADGDNISYKAYLDAGIYTFMMLCFTASDQGISDIDIDDVEVASFDLYSSSKTWNVRNTQADIAIATAGLKTVKVRLHGKNASSTSYYTAFSELALWRTA